MRADPVTRRSIFCAAILLAGALCLANEWRMPQAQFERFKNVADPRDGSGSCVQASLSMCGAHHVMPQAEFLLVDSPYGPAELGGSWPERVKAYAARRGMPIWSIEGPDSVEWIEWALKRGAYVGITYGHAHMITAVACGEMGDWFEIVDNNFPSEVRRVDRATFIREHRIHGGGWCVILATAGPPPWENAAPMVRSPTTQRRRGIRP